MVTSPDTATRAYRLDGFTIRNGKADYGGGLYLTVSASYLLTVENCTIFGNSSGYGGGVYCTSSSPTLTNCTITGNRAGYGGGLYGSSSSKPTLANCTVSLNSAASVGGIRSEASTKIINSLIVPNLGGGVDCLNSPDIGYNCVWGNIPWNYTLQTGERTGIDGNISVDPLLVAGHLLPGSPCINAGDNSVVTVDTDIDGEARIAGGRVDIGADEFHAPIVQGMLVFNDCAGSVPPMVDWEIRSGSTETRTLLLDPDGGFVIPRVPVGQFVLSVKPLSYLRRTVEVNTSGGSVLNLLEVSLTNGDIDGDKEVTLFDFGALVTAFGSMPGDSNWDANADLDGDEEVTLFDFGILVRNFGEIGDDRTGAHGGWTYPDWRARLPPGYWRNALCRVRAVTTERDPRTDIAFKASRTLT